MKGATLVLAITLLAGCTITNRTVTKTGLFNDDQEMLLSAYEMVQEGKCTKADLEDIGFYLNAPNIQQHPGADAMKAIFGEQAFNSALADKNNIDKLLAELNHYEMYTIPFQTIVTKKDQIYFSEKETERKGTSMVLVFVLKDDVVVYRGKRKREIDERETDGGFGHGAFDVVKGAAGIGGTAKSVDKLVD